MVLVNEQFNKINNVIQLETSKSLKLIVQAIHTHWWLVQYSVMVITHVIYTIQTKKSI